jgi:hypothetical protein
MKCNFVDVDRRCSTEMTAEAAYLPPLQLIAKMTEKTLANLTVGDFEKVVFCDDCARKMMKKGVVLFRFSATLAKLQRDQRRAEENARREARRDHRRTRHEGRFTRALAPATASVAEIVEADRRVNSRAISDAEEAQIRAMHDHAMLAARNNDLRAAATA